MSATESERARGVGRTSRIYDRGDGLDSSYPVASALQSSADKAQHVRQRVEARHGVNPLWKSVVRHFERQFGGSWESLDGIEREIIRFFYKKEKRDLAAPKRRPTIPEPQRERRGQFDPAPHLTGGK